MRRKALIAAASLGVTLIGWGSAGRAHTGYGLESMKGRWSYIEEWETAGQYHTSTGIFTFDGAGTCRVAYVVNDPSQTGPHEWERSTCTYELDRRGRGKLRGHVTPAEFVLTSHGRFITYVFNAAGVVGRGEMRRI